MNKNKNIVCEEHHKVTSYHQRGKAYGLKGDYSKAIKFYMKVLDIRLKTLGDEHPETADCLYSIGILYHAKGDDDKAFEFYKKVSDIVYNSKSDYDQAVEFYTKALDIRLKTLGDEHPETKISYNNLGLLFHVNGDDVKAIKFYKKAK